MKSTVLKILAFLFVALIPFCSCFAVRLDGENDGVEWEDAQFDILLNKKDSNNVNFGYVYTLVDDNGFDVYFLILLSDKPDADYESAGILLTLGNTAISVDSKGNVINPDVNNYLVSAAVKIAENDGCYFEIKVGFKKGLPENISGKVCFIDSEGGHSYHYPFTVRNKYFVTTQNEAITPEPVTEKTTRERTTVPKTTKPKASADKTVGSKTTKDDATKKSQKNAQADKTVVYFVEKDVIISQVYISENAVASAEPVCNVDEQNLVQQTMPANEMAEMYNEGVKITRVVCVVAGALLGILGIYAGFNKKPKGTESKPVSESDTTKNSTE